MTTTEQFDQWWNSNNGPDAPYIGPYGVAKAAFMAGRECGLTEASEVAKDAEARNFNCAGLPYVMSPQTPIASAILKLKGE